MNASTLPTLLQRFFADRLTAQLQASPNTIAGYPRLPHRGAGVSHDSGKVRFAETGSDGQIRFLLWPCNRNNSTVVGLVDPIGNQNQYAPAQLDHIDKVHCRDPSVQKLWQPWRTPAPLPIKKRLMVLLSEAADQTWMHPWLTFPPVA
jgi:hypothetical protein